jgi:hypothetical protein
MYLSTGKMIVFKKPIYKKRIIRILLFDVIKGFMLFAHLLFS